MHSAIAAVLDGYGGWHTVVAPRRNLRHHLHVGQIMLVVPDFTVQEPVAWHEIPTVIGRAEQYILDWISTRNDPDTLAEPAVALFLLRRQRGYNRGSVNLHDIVET